MDVYKMDNDDIHQRLSKYADLVLDTTVQTEEDRFDILTVIAQVDDALHSDKVDVAVSKLVNGYADDHYSLVRSTTLEHVSGGKCICDIQCRENVIFKGKDGFALFTLDKVTNEEIGVITVTPMLPKSKWGEGIVSRWCMFTGHKVKVPVSEIKITPRRLTFTLDVMDFQSL